MTDIIAKLRSLFTIGRDPVLGVRGGKIVFFNPVAENSFPGIKTGVLAESLISPHLLDNDSAEFVGTTIVDGRHAIVSCTTVEGVLVLTFCLESGERSTFATTPLLNSIRSTIFTLRMAADKLINALDLESDEKLTTYSAILYHNYHSLLHHTGNLQTSEHIINDALPFSPSLTNVSDVCRELVWSVESFIRGGEIEIEFVCPDEPVFGNVDRSLLEQLLTNLLSNSLEGVRPGGRIKVSIYADDEHYTIDVTDNGKGIPPDILSSVFSACERAEVKEDNVGHTGLGLYIVRGIAELHEGTIIIRSNVGIGTCVKIILPLSTSTYTLLHTSETEYRAIAFNHLLTELSGFLDNSYYVPKYIND